MYKKVEENKKATKKFLRQKSDREIEYAYRKRYENTKLTSWQREALEEEAERRGIL